MMQSQHSTYIYWSVECGFGLTWWSFSLEN